MLRILVIILLSLFHIPFSQAQKVSSLRGESGKDTLPHYLLEEIEVKGINHAKQSRRQSRLEYNVRKVYPYACTAALKIGRINKQLARTSVPKERKKIIREEYKALMKTFKKPMMKLSFSQGRILIKLICRETDNTAFSHIREYKGGFNAYFWQSLALLFGNNLKAGYDPDGKDSEIEKIVLKIKYEQQTKETN